MSERSKRKEEHLALAQMFFDSQKKNYFDQVHLVRPALPEAKVDRNSIHTKMFGKTLEAPFFINAMTGGSEKSKVVNQALGKVAAKEKIALALGSASILVKEKELLDSFYVARVENPYGVIIANVNPETPASSVKNIVSELKADALQIHLNTVQEVSMPEGDRDFLWLDNLKEIRQQVDRPIIIKEVGFGLDKETIQILKENEFDLFDISGSGGTNFAQIENSRNDADLSYLLDLGLPTPVCALIAAKEKVNFIVSGGVRNPLDVLKSLSLGGKYVGVANTFLQAFSKQNDTDELLLLVQNWKSELAALMAIFGQEELSYLTSIKKYFDLPLKNIIDQII